MRSNLTLPEIESAAEQVLETYFARFPRRDQTRFANIENSLEDWVDHYRGFLEKEFSTEMSDRLRVAERALEMIRAKIAESNYSGQFACNTEIKHSMESGGKKYRDWSYYIRRTPKDDIDREQITPKTKFHPPTGGNIPKRKYLPRGLTSEQLSDPIVSRKFEEIVNKFKRGQFAETPDWYADQKCAFCGTTDTARRYTSRLDKHAHRHICGPCLHQTPPDNPKVAEQPTKPTLPPFKFTLFDSISDDSIIMPPKSRHDSR